MFDARCRQAGLPVAENVGFSFRLVAFLLHSSKRTRVPLHAIERRETAGVIAATRSDGPPLQMKLRPVVATLAFALLAAVLTAELTCDFKTRERAPSRIRALPRGPVPAVHGGDEDVDLRERGFGDRRPGFPWGAGSRISRSATALCCSRPLCFSRRSARSSQAARSACRRQSEARFAAERVSVSTSCQKLTFPSTRGITQPPLTRASAARAPHPRSGQTPEGLARRRRRETPQTPRRRR